MTKCPVCDFSLHHGYLSAQAKKKDGSIVYVRRNFSQCNRPTCTYSWMESYQDKLDQLGLFPLHA